MFSAENIFWETYWFFGVRLSPWEHFPLVGVALAGVGAAGRRGGVCDVSWYRCSQEAEVWKDELLWKMFYVLKKCKPFYWKQWGVLWLTENFLQLTKFSKRSQTSENTENVFCQNKLSLNVNVRPLVFSCFNAWRMYISYMWYWPFHLGLGKGVEHLVPMVVLAALFLH